MPDATPRSRLRRFRRAALALVAAVALWRGYAALDDWHERREWAAACAEADRLDPGWRWSDFPTRSGQQPGQSADRHRTAATAGGIPGADR